MIYMVAIRTPELMFITDSNFITSTASLGSVSGVNVNHGYTSLIGLVFDELLKLSERPRMDNLPLLSGYFDTVSDMSQVFHDNHIPLFAVLNDGFADTMIGVLHPAILFARKQFQSALCRFRAFGLKLLTKLSIAFSGVHYFLTRELLPVGCSGGVVKSHINTYGVSTRRNNDLLFENDVDIKNFLVAIIRQRCCFRLLSFEQAALEVADSQLDVLAPIMRRDTNFFSFLDKCESPSIQIERSRFEFLGRLFTFECLRNSCDSLTNEIGWKTVFGFHNVVTEMMQAISISSFFLFRRGKNIVAAVGKTVQRLTKNICYIFINLKFALNCFN